MTGERRRPGAFQLFYASFVVSTLGDSFRLLAVNVWIFEATDGSPTDRLLLVLLANVPGMLLGGLSGVVADRYDKYAILVVADAIRIAVSLGLAWCVLDSRPWAALVLVGSGNALGVFFSTSSFALLPRLVQGSRIPRVNGMMETAQWVIQIVGPSLAAITLAMGDASVAFLLDSGSFAVSGLILWYLRAALRGGTAAESADVSGDDEDTAEHTSYWADFLAGVRVIWTRRGIRALLIASYGVAFLTACTEYSLIFLISDGLNLSTEALGFFYSLNGIVAVAAAALATALLKPAGLGRVMALSMVGLCGAQVVMGLAPNLWILGVGVVVSAAANAPYNVSVTSLYMTKVPQEYLGRVEGVDTIMDNAVSVLGFGTALLVISAWGPRAVFLLSALVALPCLVVAWRRVARSDREAGPLVREEATT